MWIALNNISSIEQGTGSIVSIPMAKLLSASVCLFVCLSVCELLISLSGDQEARRRTS